MKIHNPKNWPRSIFEGIIVTCCMEGQTDICVCGTEEQVLRAYVDGRRTEPMTSKQREWCLDEADSAGEGSYPREEGERLNDADLARWVINAWNDYVRCNVL